MENDTGAQARENPTPAEAVQNRENERAEDENAHSDNENAHFENDNARSENKTTADDNGGRVQYSIEDVEESFNIRSINDYVGVQKSVIEVLKEEGFFENGTNIAKTADNKLIVEITQRGIKETLGTGSRFQNLSRTKKRLKLASIRELPSIIRTATVVSDDTKNYHKENSSVKYAYLASRVTIDGTEYLVTVTVRKSLQKNLFWIHEIRTEEMKQANVSSGAEPQQEYKKTPVSKNKVSQPGDSVKVQKSEEDNSVSDRELLEAAEREGAGEELRRYAQKARNLEAYQKRLERQQKKLGGNEDGIPQSAAQTASWDRRTFPARRYAPFWQGAWWRREGQAPPLRFMILRCAQDDRKRAAGSKAARSKTAAAAAR